MKKFAVSALAIAALAGSAMGQPVRFELRLVPQSGTVTSPAGAGVIDLAATPNIGANADRTRRFELQYRVLDLDPNDAVFVPAGLAAASINITVGNTTAGSFDRAQLSRFEASTNTPTTPPSSPDLSGLPTPAAAAGRAGLHAPYRGGLSNANDNTLPANGRIVTNAAFPAANPGGMPPTPAGPVTTGIMGLLPLSISQPNQGNVNIGSDNTAWFGLYSFTFTAADGFGGSGTNVTITAAAEADPNTANSFGWFNDGTAVPVTSGNAVDAIVTFSISALSPPGACCLSDGTCQTSDLITCTGPNVQFQGGGTTCIPNPCPSPGACCLLDGSCALRVPIACVPQMGSFFGSGTICLPNPCPPVAACCFANSVCSVLTAANCNTQGGVMLASGSSCTPNICPPPYACCLSGFVCLIAFTESDCNAAGGSALAQSVCVPQICCPLPVVVNQPQNGLLIVPQPISLSVDATHPGAVAYRWRRDGTPITDNGRIVGTGTSVLSFTSTQPQDSASYDVVVTSVCGTTAITGSAVLTLCTAPVMLANPASQSVAFGLPLTLSVQSSGVGGLAYQWRKNGFPLSNSPRISGATTPTLLISTVEVSDDATYDCVVTNPCGSVSSQTAIITVTCNGGVADCNMNALCDLKELAGLRDLTAPNPATDDRFGWAIAMDSSRVLVGARSRDTANGIDTGAAYVFLNNPAGATLEQELIAPDGATGDDFGNQVAIESTWAVVAARSADVGGQSQAGAVYVYRLVSGSWQFFQKLAEPTPTFAAQFGHGIDLSGDRLLVGSFQGTAAQPNSGAAYVYRFNGLNWSQEFAIGAPDGQSGDGFGISVAISDPYLIVGAPYCVENGVSSGAAYVYFRGFSGWIFQSKIVPRQQQSGETFGELVAISANIAMVNAPRETVGGFPSAGAVYMFRRTDTRWTQQRRLVAESPQANELYGFYISLEGDTSAIGGFNRTVSGISGAGEVEVFKRSSNFWVRADRIDSPKPESPGWFGYSLAEAGGRLAVGAFRGSAGTVPHAGWARVFDLNALDCNNNFVPDLCEIANGAETDTNGNSIPDGCESNVCRGDFNDSGVASVQDIFDFLADYFAGNLTADFNNSSVLSVQDIFDFLSAYFAGCA